RLLTVMPLARLPEDVERYIFEIGAFSNPRSISTYMLVARRVKIWLEPLLYRTLVTGSEAIPAIPAVPLQRILDLPDAPRFTAHTHNLLCHTLTQEQILKIIALCPNV
ncbi:unnamed protein product, partial [Mycena citricolor]